jgi:hypothetical protein
MAKAQRVAELNFSDIPEMLPGARPGATTAQREAFERRSRMLHWEDVEEHMQTAARVQVAAGSGIGSTKSMEDMFPMLDGALVRSILAESPSAQHALDTLLALTASAEPMGGATAGDATSQPKHPIREVGLDDHNKFPSLVDADGWQCVSGAKLQEEERDPGSAWRDLASAAKDKPAPKAKAELVTWVRKKRPGQQKVEELEQTQPYTDYECRHRAGECRAKQRVKYSRGAGAGLSGCGGGRDAGGDIAQENQEEFDPSDV